MTLAILVFPLTFSKALVRIFLGIPFLSPLRDLHHSTIKVWEEASGGGGGACVGVFGGKF